MKLANILTGIVLTSVISVVHIPTGGFSPMSAVAADQTSIKEKIAALTKNKGNIGSGDQLRRWFFEDLQPIGIQAGGTGTVVNLYSKKHNFTFSYCSDFDVVIAIKSGKVTKFPDSEVK
jgi:hypothetical protein